MDEVKGYKAFNNDATNRYGQPFTEGETYSVDGDIKFGNTGNGYHMCKSLSDVFRYVNAVEEDVLVAEVTGRGKCAKYDDTYYGYYDMYSFEEITIDRFLTRDEIIEKMLNSPIHEVNKFLMTCKLTEREKEVLSLITKGKNNSKIARELCVSVHTVKAHLESIFEKTGAINRVQAAVYAIINNLI